jgi:hypothetical protein
MRDFRDFKQRGLSGSEDGRGIAIAATTSPGTLIHTALSSPAANEWDEITLWAVNQAATAITLTVEWGGTTSADRIVLQVPAASGLHAIMTDGLVLHNGKEVRAYASAVGAIILHGSVRRFEQSL